MTYKEEMAKIDAEISRIREVREQFEREMNAPRCSRCHAALELKDGRWRNMEDNSFVCFIQVPTKNIFGTISSVSTSHSPETAPITPDQHLAMEQLASAYHPPFRYSGD